MLQAALSLFGMLGCPMLGLFTLGMLFPWANKWGAYAGLLTSLAVMFWVGVGTHIAQLPPKLSSRRTDGCNWTLVNGHQSHMAGDGFGLNLTSPTFTLDLNTTSAASMMNTTVPVEHLSESASIEDIYELSYLWYSVLAVFVVIVVGLIVSFATGCQDPKELDPRLVQPLCSIICPMCPTACLSSLHCGVQQHKRGEWEEREAEQKLTSTKSKGTPLIPDVEVEMFEKNGVFFEEETLKLRPKAS
ncbi:sodium-dependent multivitamin transporter-like [Littorina saxatilis]|uniref:sodium-dependent multivitamin transporter-like n=1 Tax=Littorina saxatilis TaxID=31220 RepID=UPI0038B68BE5